MATPRPDPRARLHPRRPPSRHRQRQRHRLHPPPRRACGARTETLTSPWEAAKMKKRYTVSDGKLVLTLEEADEGGYIVTAPLEPELITEAETVAEAFANARDALQALARSRIKLLRQLSPRPRVPRTYP